MKVSWFCFFWIYFLWVSLFIGCQPAEEPPSLPAPCDPKTQQCPSETPSETSSTPCDPQTQQCPSTPAPSESIEIVDYFTITNALSANPNERVVILNKTNNQAVPFPSGKCAKVHKNLYAQGVNIYLIKDGKNLRICRPDGRRYSYPDAGTKTYGCRNEGSGFGRGEVQNYKIENTGSMTVDSSQTLPSVCPLIIK